MLWVTLFRLRKETTMTLAWIAKRLQMGAPGQVSCLLYRNERNPTEANEGKSEKKWFLPRFASPQELSQAVWTGPCSCAGWPVAFPAILVSIISGSSAKY